MWVSFVRKCAFHTFDLDVWWGAIQVSIQDFKPKFKLIITWRLLLFFSFLLSQIYPWGIIAIMACRIVFLLIYYRWIISATIRLNNSFLTFRTITIWDNRHISMTRLFRQRTKVLFVSLWTQVGRYRWINVIIFFYFHGLGWIPNNIFRRTSLIEIMIYFVFLLCLLYQQLSSILYMRVKISFIACHTYLF